MTTIERLCPSLLLASVLGLVAGCTQPGDAHDDDHVTAAADEHEHEHEHESHEGRTTIDAGFARAAGIVTATAGPGVVEEAVLLYGSIVPEPTRVRHVGARFSGEIETVAVALGERVAAGQTLATIEANDSLQRYSVRAPIAGLVTAVAAAAGEQTGSEPLFVIADYSTVWAELAVFPRDLPALKPGLEALVSQGETEPVRGVIDYIAPHGERGSQATTARVVLDNAAGVWTPGRFVEAHVVTRSARVDVAVPLSALQTFRDSDVVFARYGDVYEARMLELGRRGLAHVEVLDGLAPGTEYVVEGSYVVKADVEKAGASHDH